MSSTFDANSTTTDRRAWLETYLEPMPTTRELTEEATQRSPIPRYSPRISTVLGLYLVALLTTGSVGNSGLPSFMEVTASNATRAAAAPLPGPVALPEPESVRVPLRLEVASADQPAARPAAAPQPARASTAPEAAMIAHHHVSAAETAQIEPAVHEVSIHPGDFKGLLEPAGIGRRFWRSFSHIPPFTGPQSKPARYVVMLDPGHGGIDPGSIGPDGLQEKHLTLDIARRTALFLSEISEIEVRLTRDDDTGMARYERVARVRQSEADLIVSLHLNQLPQREVTLTETFYAGPQNLRGAAASGTLVHASTNDPADAPDFVADSARVARLLQRRVFNEVDYDNPGAVNAGVKRRTLYVLSQSVTPGVLVELTCLSNPREEARLATEAYRNRLAAALADGIRDYFAENDPLVVADNSI